jgi:flagellar protein FliS
MGNNAHDAYLESRILTAEPIELTRLLYQAATGAVRDARRCLLDRDIAGRSRSISKACDVLMELTGALDHERGAEISGRLAQLYGYMQRRLIEANFEQSDPPLVEVLGLLSTLSEAWNGVSAEAAPPEAAASPWGHTVPQDSLPFESHAWSF